MNPTKNEFLLLLLLLSSSKINKINKLNKFFIKKFTFSHKVYFVNFVILCEFCEFCEVYKVYSQKKIFDKNQKKIGWFDKNLNIYTTFY